MNLRDSNYSWCLVASFDFVSIYLCRKCSSNLILDFEVRVDVTLEINITRKIVQVQKQEQASESGDLDQVGEGIREGGIIDFLSKTPLVTNLTLEVVKGDFLIEEE